MSETSTETIERYVIQVSAGQVELIDTRTKSRDEFLGSHRLEYALKRKSHLEGRDHV
jgi:hypothetical protein